MIAAGLITAAQLPGTPGMPRSSAIFLDGVLQPRGSKPARSERWLQVTLYGRKVRVTKGISHEEEQRRIEARQAEIQELARSEPKADIGFDGARKAFAEASTLFKVGDSVRVGQHSLVVTGEYKLYLVRDKDGEFVDSKGGRFNYQHGYCCQYRNGEEFFYPAHMLSNDDGEPTHLRLVAGKSTQALRPMMEFRERERM
ncbi:MULTISPECIES: hypothetical protein [unclassified Variovorax]|nr:MULTISPECIES: hypothetical protein [unclassified Variovorax]